MYENEIQTDLDFEKFISRSFSSLPSFLQKNTHILNWKIVHRSQAEFQSALATHHEKKDRKSSYIFPSFSSKNLKEISMIL